MKIIKRPSQVKPYKATIADEIKAGNLVPIKVFEINYKPAMKSAKPIPKLPQ